MSEKHLDLERIQMICNAIIMSRGLPDGRVQFTHVDGYVVVLKDPELHVSHALNRISGKGPFKTTKSYDIWEIKRDTIQILSAGQVV
ncbi:hypothetical protein EVB32_077 [Rhizobium phage RHph_TM39]|uniref:Uncharacterized protein n=1 Tax=Rhizobium phage RHph_Y65 TaxID=2509785 RepID=A0A7S5UWR0_9CAUD|nr:hypothetical protein PQC17_gp075 [Rhizobium phage RHph_Y65]QIG71548.1 hypothetical protein EVB94_077 [Rhizobium phage RHph_TM40]QIG71911.1 hypothetical protein EVB95_077 [Rhizobium phage RHph_TM2_3B]QIG72273.1 hypothetical protein EVB96_077 [Rhizobium phage RHph_TM3_3_6]QIG77065.1 hypothetical protein EVB32_077 [Rhizobium phage RHph_TM39]QIG77664.1 hypothetical protein EVB64_077 [Rhizobium phage RHph_TM61]